jgi:Ca-activated chloride channel family protein
LLQRPGTEPVDPRHRQPRRRPGDSGSGEFLKDEQGAILVPRLDSPGLKAFASEMGGHYRAAAWTTKTCANSACSMARKPCATTVRLLHLDTWADQGYWLLLPLLLLAACAGRRGWLFCLPLLLLTAPQPSYAFGLQDLWLRPDQQGQHLLKKNARPRPPNTSKTRNGKAWRCTRGDYAEAIKRFARGNDAYAHYNRGNALAKSGELEARDRLRTSPGSPTRPEPALKTRPWWKTCCRNSPGRPSSRPTTGMTKPANPAKLQPGASGQSATAANLPPKDRASRHRRRPGRRHRASRWQ